MSETIRQDSWSPIKRGEVAQSLIRHFQILLDRLKPSHLHFVYSVNVGDKQYIIEETPYKGVDDNPEFNFWDPTKSVRDEVSGLFFSITDPKGNCLHLSYDYRNNSLQNGTVEIDPIRGEIKKDADAMQEMIAFMAPIYNAVATQVQTVPVES